jgi:hypothetical protein
MRKDETVMIGLIFTCAAAMSVILVIFGVSYFSSDRTKCLESGGTWVTVKDTKPYCITALERVGRRAIDRSLTSKRQGL